VMNFWGLGTGLFALFTLTDWLLTRKAAELAGSWKIEANPLIRQWRGRGFFLSNLIPLALIVAAFFYAPLIYAVFFLAGTKFLSTIINLIICGELMKKEL